jgi:hypothetical protein
MSGSRGEGIMTEWILVRSSQAAKVLPVVYITDALGCPRRCLQLGPRTRTYKSCAKNNSGLGIATSRNFKMRK